VVTWPQVLCALVAVGALVFFFWWLFRPRSPSPATDTGMLNGKQRKCLWIGIVVFVLMGLFPPWYHAGDTWSQYRYGFLCCPPKGWWNDPNRRYRLDTDRLYVKWVLVVVVTGSLVWAFHGRKPEKPPQDPANTPIPPEPGT
jgi:hypothetical protein